MDEAFIARHVAFGEGTEVNKALAAAGDAVALRAGPVELVEPAAALSAVLAARALPGVLVLGVLPMIVLAVALGPVACAWTCPYGLVSEGIDALRSRREPPAARGDGPAGSPARSPSQRPPPDAGIRSRRPSSDPAGRAPARGPIRRTCSRPLALAANGCRTGAPLA